MKISALVVYRLTVEMDVDESKLNDSQYVEEIRDAIKTRAEKDLIDGVQGVIHECDAPELVE